MRLRTVSSSAGGGVIDATAISPPDFDFLCRMKGTTRLAASGPDPVSSCLDGFAWRRRKKRNAKRRATSAVPRMLPAIAPARVPLLTPLLSG